ncbi:MAG: hypothetical protein LWW95_11690 [Candidatus Desulfofervidus auxilii]|nr:hypothetical protein [Candidatus Desulfofervidus auxilii]
MITRDEKRVLFEILQFIEDLCKKQQDDGSWDEEHWSNLHRAVISCQIGLLLSKLIWGDIYKCKRCVLDLLSSPIFASCEYSYWRCLPLIYLGADRSTLEDALKQLENIIKQGVFHHPHSPIKEFYLECVFRILGKDTELSHEIIKEVIDDISREEYNKWTAQKITYTLLNLELRKILDENISCKILKVVTNKSNFQSGYRFWETLISTIYVIVNLSEIYNYTSSEKVKSSIEEILKDAIKFILKKWKDRDFYSEPLAGGDFDKTPYVKIVMARSILSYYLNIRNIKAEELFNEYEKQKRRRRRRKIFKYTIISIFSFLITFLLYGFREETIELINNQTLVNIITLAAGIISVATGIGAIRNYFRHKK